MAGEKLGRLYEAVLFIAIDAELTQQKKKIKRYWNPSVEGLMVQPDIVIGDLGDPKCILMVTQSIARRSGDKKFWRTVGEIVDVRSVCSKASILNIAFGTELKDELNSTLSFIADANILPSYSERELLHNWAVQNSPSIPKSKDELLEYSEIALRKSDSKVRNIWKSISLKVLSFVRSNSNQPSPISNWILHRLATANVAAAEWRAPGSYRRGLAKIFSLGDPSYVLSQINKQMMASDALAPALEANQWAEKAVGGWRVIDEELCLVLTNVSRKEVVQVLRDSTSETLRMIAADIQSEEFLKSSAKFISDNGSNLGSIDWVLERLNESKRDPSLRGELANVPNDVGGCWFFRCCVALIKCVSGSKQGYGYEQFIADVRLAAKDKGLVSHLLSIGATKKKVISAGRTDTFRRKLIDWVSGSSQDDLEPWQLYLAAYVLAARFGKASEAELQKAVEMLPAFIRRTTYEDRIAPYPYFEPVKARVAEVLQDSEISFVEVPRKESLVTRLKVGGRRVGTTNVIQADKCLIHWKSAHGSHVGDKTKELCGRGFCLRHQVNGDQVAAVPDVDSLILVLDGDFRDKDVMNLVRCGWDHVIPFNRVADIPALIESRVASEG